MSKNQFKEYINKIVYSDKYYWLIKFQKECHLWTNYNQYKNIGIFRKWKLIHKFKRKVKLLRKMDKLLIKNRMERVGEILVARVTIYK